MKKFLAIILVLATLLSLSACDGKQLAKKIKSVVNQPQKQSQLQKSGEEKKQELKQEFEEARDEALAEFEEFSNIVNFDEFAEKMEKDFEVKKSEQEDGSVVIEMTIPTAPTKDKTDKSHKNETETKPAIPTIDKVQTPTEEKEDKVVPAPQKPDTEDKTTSDNKAQAEDTKEPEKGEEKTPQIPTNTKKEEIEEVKKPQYTYVSGQTHTKLHYSKRYLYSLLTDEQKEWYRAIDKAVTNLEPRTSINANLSEDRHYMIYYLYMFDNPEHFYLGNTVTIFNKGDNTGDLIFCYSDGELTCNYGTKLKEINEELRTRIKAKKAIFEAEVSRILSTIPANAPDVWKEKLIYDRILMDSYYNLSARWDGYANDNWTAYGIMVNKYGVCESYSEAFQTLCLYAGINCTGVIGNAGGGHKWNCLMLDGEWYMCDITFDDPIGGEQGAAYHYYFNLTSQKMMELNHDWSSSEWPVPNCTATKYAYNNFFE